MIAETGGSPATAKPAPALSQPTAGIAHGLTVTLPGGFALDHQQ
jgi:hypothetical protein